MKNLLIAALAATAAFGAESAVEKRLEAATIVINETMTEGDKSIPKDLLIKSECAVVVPGLKKGAFIIGARFGRGFLTCRTKDGSAWTAPGAVKIEGGSIGLQAGGAEVDVVLLVMNQSGINNPGAFSIDTYSVLYHGYAHTHMDALCHMFYRGKMFNGFSQEEVTEKGARRLSIHNLKNGIFTRGILLDFPRLKGVPYLEPGTPIYPEDLEAWEKQAGVKVSSGDVVFVRTGRWARRAALGPRTRRREGR